MSGETTDRTGITAGLVCYGLWGLFPLLFQAVERTGAGAFEIVAWRTVWAAPFALVLVLAVGQAGKLRRLGGRTVGALALSAALIAVNWSVYVWAVTHGRTLEASLGYYLNPLLNMAAGRLLFGERIDRAGWAAVTLAGAGVALQAVALGAFPGLALLLAASFCGYGVVRKRLDVPAQTGLLVECVLLLAPAFAFLAWNGRQAGGGWAPARGGAQGWLLFLCGPATVAPLACFAIAARRLPLTVLGFLQFVSPTLQFAIGVAEGEALTPLRLASFALIWAGVAMFAAAALARGRAERAATRRTAPA